MAALQLPRQRLFTLWQALGGALWHTTESLVEDGMLLMGRRDKRTKKGKIFKGIGGKMRPNKPQHHFPEPWWHLPEVDLRNPIPIYPHKGMHAWRERLEAEAAEQAALEGEPVGGEEGGEEVEGDPSARGASGELAGELEGAETPEGGWEQGGYASGEGAGIAAEDVEYLDAEDDVDDEDDLEDLDAEEDTDTEPEEYTDGEGYWEGDAEGLEVGTDEEWRGGEGLAEGEASGLGYDVDPFEGESGEEGNEPSGAEFSAEVELGLGSGDEGGGEPGRSAARGLDRRR